MHTPIWNACIGLCRPLDRQPQYDPFGTISKRTTYDAVKAGACDELLMDAVGGAYEDQSLTTIRRCVEYLNGLDPKHGFGYPVDPVCLVRCIPLNTQGRDCIGLCD